MRTSLRLIGADPAHRRRLPRVDVRHALYGGCHSARLVRTFITHLCSLRFAEGPPLRRLALVRLWPGGRLV